MKSIMRVTYFLLIFLVVLTIIACANSYPDQIKQSLAKEYNVKTSEIRILTGEMVRMVARGNSGRYEHWEGKATIKGIGEIEYQEVVIY